MLEQLGRIPWRNQIRVYGILVGVCLVLAAGINTLMDQARQDRGESEVEGLKKAFEGMKDRKP